MRAQLASVAHRAAVDCMRRQVNVRDRRLRYSQLPLAVVPDLDDVADEVLVAERLRFALEALPDNQAGPIRLAVNHRKTYRQVARMLGEPEDFVKARMRSGLLRLGEAMGSRDAT